MGSSILNVGKSALAAAQAGLVTTGHNIANASTPGYSRQVVVQASAGSQNFGSGYLGNGTEVVDIKRVYNELLAAQVRTAETNKNRTETYYRQISQINNLLADSTAGLSPALQDFFDGVQRMASNSSSTAAAGRQIALSSAETLAARYQSLDGQLKEMAQSANSQIHASISSINVYAEQIAKLNDAIEKTQGNADGKASNDLLDQRDLAVTELSKEIKATVVKQGNSYNIFIGNGQPLVVGGKTFNLVPAQSHTDPSRAEVGYFSNGKIQLIDESVLTGGKLGGLFEFRANSLDAAQNALGRVAIGMAMTFNAQHRLGQDQNGDPGGDFFVAGKPRVEASALNNQSVAAKIDAVINDPSKLTTSDYHLERVADGDFVVKRLSDGKELYRGGAFPAADNVIEGVTLKLPSPLPAIGDKFMIRPTADGAAQFRVAIKDTAKIAAGAPLRTETPVDNHGTGKIGPATVSSALLIPGGLSLNYAPPVAPATAGTLSGFPSQFPITVSDGSTSTTYPAGTTSILYSAGDTITVNGVGISGLPVGGSPDTFNIGSPSTTLTYNAGTPATLTGFPANVDVTIMHGDGSTETVQAGSPTTVNFKAGDTLSFGGVSFTVSGDPIDGDVFKISANLGGVGDGRNAVALGALQTANTLIGGSTSYQGAYAQLVSLVGNKTRELEVTSKAEATYLKQAVNAQQSESGVNLDEEAANLLRYQQAYQAAGKVMQTASQLFEILLSLGGR